MSFRTSRRAMLAGAGVAVTGSLAGCLGSDDDDDPTESDIDVWIENEERGEFGYELRVDDFEERGILGRNERDTWEDALERGDEPRDVEMEVKIGFWSDGEEGEEDDGEEEDEEFDDEFEHEDEFEDEDEFERKVEEDELQLVVLTEGAGTETIDEDVIGVFARLEEDGLFIGTEYVE